LGLRESPESIYRNLRPVVQGGLDLVKQIVLIAALILFIVSPALADTIPNTDPNLTMPNQWGFDNVVVNNISQTELNNITVGNLVYPPIYEKNAVVIPFEIWLVFLILGFVFLGSSVAIPVPQQRAISAAVALGFFGYDYVLSPLIGWTDLAWNSQALQLIGSNYTVFTIAQPVITIYSPPYLWAFLLLLALVSALMVFWGIGGIIREAAEAEKQRRKDRSNARLDRLMGEER
jgi:hypothetical protein